MCKIESWTSLTSVRVLESRLIFFVFCNSSVKSSLYLLHLIIGGFPNAPGFTRCIKKDIK